MISCVSGACRAWATIDFAVEEELSEAIRSDMTQSSDSCKRSSKSGEVERAVKSLWSGAGYSVHVESDAKSNGTGNCVYFPPGGRKSTIM
jgi:hypothetical protein